ncbi:Probable phospholipid ABC transporter permease protein mlaE [Oligella urethralis]|uniref:Probable phospholipid ABC transporter permease protein mlaE n=1 Tax=Oligella urethralis TaxID=90245 RepID=A0A2X1WQT0_9BURK|nr:Probable phospholipid ABC transporter permease protein mlaE [Oligella urethralis]
MYSWIASIGGYVINGIGHLGNIFILLVQIVLRSALIFKRPRLLVEQILFIGVYSLLIIAVSGLFVGFVLGFQGYSILSMFGSEQALGLMVALSLLRELGPSGDGLIVCWACGHLDYGRNRFDEGR